MPNLLELQDLYEEALVREILEKTLSAGMIWNNLGGTQFKATQQVAAVSPEPAHTWEFYVTKTQVGSLTYKYNLDIKKDGVAYQSIDSGITVYTKRESSVQELYETVELLVLKLDQRMTEALQLVQNIEDVRNHSEGWPHIN